MKKSFGELSYPFSVTLGDDRYLKYEQALKIMEFIRKKTIEECKKALIHPDDWEADFCGADLLDKNSIEV
mgnify:CR=1 FL=1